MKCTNCSDYTHHITRCPFINYVPNKKKLIQNIWIDNNRKQIRNPVIIRGQKRTTKSLSYLDSLHNAAAQILIDLNYYDNKEELQERLIQIEKVRYMDRYKSESQNKNNSSIVLDQEKPNIKVPDFNHEIVQDLLKRK